MFKISLVFWRMGELAILLSIFTNQTNIETQKKIHFKPKKGRFLAYFDMARKLVRVFLYNIFICYFGMISR